MAKYSTAEALRLIMQEDTDSDDKDSVTEEDENSEDGDCLPGAGTDSDTDSRRVSCRAID